MAAFPIHQTDQMPVIRTEFHFNENQIKDGLLSVNNDALSYFTREKFKEKFDSTYNLLSKFKLKRLISNLDKQISYSSSPDSILLNPDFKEIVSLGSEAIPFILEEIESKPSFLVWSLNLITGRRISEKKVSVSEASKLWINWGKRMKLIA